MSARTELVSVVVELTAKGGQTDRMTHVKKRQLLNRQTKEHLIDQCEMAFLTVHLGMSVEASVGGLVDPAVEDFQTDRRDQGLMNSLQSETSMAVIVHHDEADIAGGVVNVRVLESALKEQIPMTRMARTMVVLMSDMAGMHQISREIAEVLANGKSGKDLMKMWNEEDLMTEEVGENLFVVAEVVDVVLAEVGEVLIGLVRETTIDILKGMFVLICSFFMNNFQLLYYFVGRD